MQWSMFTHAVAAACLPGMPFLASGACGVFKAAGDVSFTIGCLESSRNGMPHIQFCLFAQPQLGILTLESRPWPLLCVCRFGDLALDAVEEGDDEECEEGSDSEQRRGPSSSALVADSDGGVAGLSSSEEVDAAVKQVGLRLT